MQCRRCWSFMDEGASYCGVCGASVVPAGVSGVSGTSGQRAASRGSGAGGDAAVAGAPARPAVKPTARLGCELAYSGVLFWVPLVVCPGERNARFCANQGAWALLLAVVACALMGLVGAADAALAGEVVGVLFDGVRPLAWVVFLTFMGMLAWRCSQSAMAIHCGERPESIWFFDEARIIKEA